LREILAAPPENYSVGPLIAIDVAILPPRHVADAAIALSASLPRTESQGLQLDSARLPHVTLTQQFVLVAELPQVAAAVERIVNRSPPITVRITGAGRGTNSVWMQIERTPDLHQLHEALMDALLPFERRGGQADAFAAGDARPNDLEWVSGFRGRSSYERFTPHITLGHASRLPGVEPMTFDADTVVLCHLGRFCTCREVLRSWLLRERV
jgi:2'-5' RNA ligase